MFVIDGKEIPSLKEKNKKAAENWKFLSYEERQRYFDAAKQSPWNQISTTAQNTWTETNRILRNLHNTVSAIIRCRHKTAMKLSGGRSVAPDS